MPRITPAVLNLMIINGLVFVAWQLLPMEFMSEYFLLWKIPDVPFRDNLLGSAPFLPLQIITTMFSQADLMHLLFNLYALYLFGTMVETAIGAKRFLIQYMSFGLGAGILIAIFDPSGNPVLGASAAISGVMVAAAFYYPRVRLGMLFIPIQFRLVHYVIGLAAFSAFFVIQEISTGKGSGVSHFGHFMGMIVAAAYLFTPKLIKLMQGK